MPALGPQIVRDTRGWYTYAAPFREELWKQLEAVPGCHKINGVWKIPIECAPLFDFLHPPENPPASPVASHTAARTLQRQATPWLMRERVCMLAHETGLGKTLSVIDALRLLGLVNVLIICPAIARKVWTSELARWWPDHPKANRISSGKKASLAAERGVCIISYHLLHALPEIYWGGWDAVVFDESQNVQNPDAKMSEWAALVRRANPEAFCVMMSATPIINEPISIHNQLDILKGGSAGKRYNFAERYCGWKHSEYGKVPAGLNEEFAHELSRRLGGVMHRATKREWAHELPAFLTPIVRIKPPKRMWNPRELSEAFSSGLRKQHEIEGFIQKAGAEKFNHILRAALDSAEIESHVVIITYFKETARAYAAAMRAAGHPVLHVDGDEMPDADKRIAAIEEAKFWPRCVLVATMSSINVAIDLTKWTIGHLAELYWQTLLIVQVLGRFSRFSSIVPSTMYVYVLEGSTDERMAYVLSGHLKEQNTAYGAGHAEKLLLDGFTQKMTDAELFDALDRAVESMVQEDYL